MQALRRLRRFPGVVNMGSPVREFQLPGVPGPAIVIEQDPQAAIDIQKRNNPQELKYHPASCVWKPGPLILRVLQHVDVNDLAAGQDGRGAGNGTAVVGKTVLELGSGPGLLGVALARLGADVLATDGAELALSLLKRNRKANLHPSSASKSTDGTPTGSWGRFEVNRLQWGCQTDIDACRKLIRNMNRKHLETPDLVCLSEVLYESNICDGKALVNSVAALLGPNSTGILCQYSCGDADLEGEFYDYLRASMHCIDVPLDLVWPTSPVQRALNFNLRTIVFQARTR
eukprot:TRINITY_DN47479_c0_g1_i1.p1 TRINITY_DN47479_c0_g1~~TRINITY_DN47479_c0_g1_i1.p1  ORF type:complete len:287 (+),score=31.33 TRINITY_DN47479_c0_g1_i1:54-914(+)